MVSNPMGLEGRRGGEGLLEEVFWEILIFMVERGSWPSFWGLCLRAQAMIEWHLRHSWMITNNPINVLMMEERSLKNSWLKFGSVEIVGGIQFLSTIGPEKEKSKLQANY
ncbi:uncharacterized protein BT62DRAFT_920687 [Guyanagaster necrorhizus]|uniref:Uncharacterized protein n=1 Tax=Guyanagaster necrorhizus TaxID=856835 RepID=A0A9P7VQL9_9AGAR|nr:uncharacterized protein BT62DRAFT_920687 [Guyanagaster necrorhizus MCA 3950]KAG7444878.1 hypothetical protein BT62DRAFT_920687 [Guyanagaster necrorhizus MCA 3950]